MGRRVGQLSGTTRILVDEGPVTGIDRGTLTQWNNRTSFFPPFHSSKWKKVPGKAVFLGKQGVVHFHVCSREGRTCLQLDGLLFEPQRPLLAEVSATHPKPPPCAVRWTGPLSVVWTYPASKHHLKPWKSHVLTKNDDQKASIGPCEGHGDQRHPENPWDRRLL